MTSVILEKNLVLPQVLLHSLAVHQTSQDPTKDQSIKSGNHSGNLMPKLSDKLLHDVLLFGVLSTSRKSTTTLYRGTSMSHLRLAALCFQFPHHIHRQGIP